VKFAPVAQKQINSTKFQTIREKAKKMPSKSKWTDAPFDDSQPEKFDIDVGEAIEGTLGPVSRDTKYDRLYRILTTTEASSKENLQPGNYFLNENKNLKAQSVFGVPEGMPVCITRTNDIATRFEHPMRTYKVQFDTVALKAAKAVGELPF